MRGLLPVVAITGSLALAGCGSRGPEDAAPGRPNGETSVIQHEPPALFESRVRVYSKREPAPPPASVKFDIGASVPVEVADAARRATAGTVQLFAERYDQDLSSVTVHVHWNVDDHVDALLAALDAQGLTGRRENYVRGAQGGDSFQYEGDIFFFPRPGTSPEVATQQVWDAIPRNAVEMVQHELAGQKYGDRGWVQLVGGVVPDWFIKGQEQFVVAAVRATYFPTEGTTVSIKRPIPSPTANTRTLREVAADDLDNTDINADEYKLGLAAIDALAADDPYGANAFAFWESLGNDVPYPEAFRGNFGLTPDEFYERFEASRRAVG